jgi:hypothetical protein
VSDLITAKDVLREKLSEAGIRELSLHARAAAAVTAMCEFILKAGTKGALSMSITKKNDMIDIELCCEITWLASHLGTLGRMRYQQVADLQNLLTRVTDDVECND